MARRGPNVERFSRSFSIGDIVRFENGGKICFGEIVKKLGKMYEIKRLLDGSGHQHIHAHELESIVIPKNFLTTMIGAT